MTGDAGRDRWRRAQELFEAAADLRPAEQAAYLAAACPGDDDLRREVEALLRSDALAGSFIEHAIRRGSDRLLASQPDPLEALGKIGKYEILGRIGEGGFGVVYKGRDAVLQRYVAVKTCSSSDEKLRRRFFREGQIAASLQHPNITTVHDLGVERGIPYLVQEFLAGEDLNHKIARREDITAVRRLDILVQVARGLEYAHEQGVLHRDVKPANIRVLPDGAVKIMDFGIAKLLHEVSDVTTKGVTMGTVGYLAPEQLRGEEVDRRTDVFAFGVLAHELLTYERPFKGSTFSEVSYRLLNEEPAALQAIAPAHGGAIAELTTRCLAKDPAGRPASFGEVLAVLEPELAALRSGPLPLPAVAGEAAVPAAAGSGVPAARGAAPMAPATATEGALDIASAGGARRRFADRRALAAAVAAAAVAIAAALLMGGWRALLYEVEQVKAPGAAGHATAGATAGRRAASVGPTSPLPGPAERPVPGRAAVELPAGVGDGQGGLTTGEDGGPTPVAGAVERAGAARGGPSVSAGRGRGAAGPRRPPEAPPTDSAAGKGAGRPSPADSADAAAGAADPESAGRGPRFPPDLVGGPAAAGAAPGTPPTSTGAAGPAAPAGVQPGDAHHPPGAAPGRGQAEGDGATRDGSRPMVRGDLIPPGAPGASPPRLLSRPEPQYPDRARRRQAESDVLLLVLVDENGQVIRAIVKETDDPGIGFNEAARLAALRARFSPATRDGLAGKMWTELPFSFRLHPDVPSHH